MRNIISQRYHITFKALNVALLFFVLAKNLNPLPVKEKISLFHPFDILYINMLCVPIYIYTYIIILRHPTTHHPPLHKSQNPPNWVSPPIPKNLGSNQFHLLSQSVNHLPFSICWAFSALIFFHFLVDTTITFVYK